MDNNYYSPVQIIENNIKAGVNKANMGLLRMIVLGIFAGMFIAVGAEASSLAAHNLTDVGVARTLTGVVFPVGLMMLVVIGGELFTGNCMMTMALADRKITWIGMLKNWIVVYFSNMLGSVLTAACVYASGQYDYSAGGLGAYTIKIAMGKADMDFSKALFFRNSLQYSCLCGSSYEQCIQGLDWQIVWRLFPDYGICHLRI